MIFRPSSAVARVLDVDTGALHVLTLTKIEARFASKVYEPDWAVAVDQRTGRLWTLRWSMREGFDLEGYVTPFAPEAVEAEDVFGVYGDLVPCDACGTEHYERRP